MRQKSMNRKKNKKFIKSSANRLKRITSAASPAILFILGFPLLASDVRSEHIY